MPTNYRQRRPFKGIMTELPDKGTPPAYATSADNCTFQDGDVTQRPGLGGDTTLGAIDDVVLSVRYIGGTRDQAFAIGETSAWVLRWDEDQQFRTWTRCVPRDSWVEPVGTIGLNAGDAYFGVDDQNYVLRNKLDNVTLDHVGMEPFTSDCPLPAAAAYATAYTGGSDYLEGDVVTYISRYNIHTGLESNAMELNEVTSLTTDAIDIAFGQAGDTAGDYVAGLKGYATHYRLYQFRSAAYGQAGLLAQVPVDEEAMTTTWTYRLGDIEQEANGDSTYTVATDETDYNYVPCTQNGIPPRATCFEMHNGRMFYGTSSGLIYFSQSVDELQGHVEAVATSSYRVLPVNEPIVAIRSYRDTLFIFTPSRVYRWSGLVNSLTNAQVVLGSTLYAGTDALDKLADVAGLAAHDSVVEAETHEGNHLFYAGHDNIYRFDGVDSYPVGDDIHTLHTDRLEECSSKISSANMNKDHQVLFCYKDTGCLVYDYRSKHWEQWDTYPLSATTDASLVGPVCTEALHDRKSRTGLMLIEDSSGTLHGLTFDKDLLQDNGVNFTATWIGPEMDLDMPEEKRWYWLMANFAYQSSGTVQVYANAAGTQIPTSPFAWPQSSFRKTQPKQPLGCRTFAIQPCFQLAQGVRSNLLGWVVRYERMLSV